MLAADDAEKKSWRQLSKGRQDRVIRLDGLRGSLQLEGQCQRSRDDDTPHQDSADFIRGARAPLPLLIIGIPARILPPLRGAGFATSLEWKAAERNEAGLFEYIDPGQNSVVRPRWLDWE